MTRTRTKLTNEQKKQAIEEFAKTGNYTLTAKAISVERLFLLQEQRRNKPFRTALQNARAIYTDKLEAILDERIEHHEKDRASALLLMFKLKAEMPDKYRERVDHKIDTEVHIIHAIPGPPQLEAGRANFKQLPQGKE